MLVLPTPAIAPPQRPRTAEPPCAQCIQYAAFVGGLRGNRQRLPIRKDRNRSRHVRFPEKRPLAREEGFWPHGMPSRWALLDHIPPTIAEWGYSNCVEAV